MQPELTKEFKSEPEISPEKEQKRKPWAMNFENEKPNRNNVLESDEDETPGEEEG